MQPMPNFPPSGNKKTSKKDEKKIKQLIAKKVVEINKSQATKKENQ
jgi:hypothetical protein